MEANVTPMKTGLKYGLYLGLVISIFGLAAHYGGLQEYDTVELSSTFLVSAINWIILAIMFFMGIKYFKDNNEGQLTFGEGMTTAMFIALVSGIISVIFTFILYKYLAPDALGSLTDAAMDSTNQDLSELSEEDRKEAEEMMGSILGIFTSPGFMAASAFLNRIFSAIIFGLISSLILKTD